MSSKTFKRLALLLSTVALSVALLSCGVEINAPGLDGQGDESKNTTPSVNITPIVADSFALSSSYRDVSGDYAITYIKQEKNSVSLSTRKVPLTFFPAESNTVNVSVVSGGLGGSESKYIKASIVNRKVQFEIIPGVAPESDLFLLLESANSTESLPIAVTDARSWKRVRSLSLVDMFGDTVGSPTENLAEFVSVLPAEGANHDQVSSSGRFRIDFGNGVVPSNPDVYVEVGSPEFFDTALVRDGDNFYLDVLPLVDDASTVIRVTSVEDASFTTVIKASPPGVAIRGFKPDIISALDVGKRVTQRFSVSRLPQGSVVKLTQDEKYKVFSSIVEDTVPINDKAQTIVEFETITSDNLVDGETATLTATVYTDKTLQTVLHDDSGEEVLSDISVKVEYNPRIGEVTSGRFATVFQTPNSTAENLIYTDLRIRGLEDYSLGGISETKVPFTLADGVNLDEGVIEVFGEDGAPTDRLQAYYKLGLVRFTYAEGGSAQEFVGKKFTLKLADKNSYHLVVVPVAFNDYVLLQGGIGFYASTPPLLDEPFASSGWSGVFGIDVPVNSDEAMGMTPYSDVAIPFEIGFGGTVPTDTGLKVDIQGSGFETELIEIKGATGTLSRYMLMVSAKEVGRSGRIRVTTSAVDANGNHQSLLIKVKSTPPTPRLLPVKNIVMTVGDPSKTFVIPSINGYQTSPASEDGFQYIYGFSSSGTLQVWRTTMNTSHDYFKFTVTSPHTVGESILNVEVGTHGYNGHRGLQYTSRIRVLISVVGK